MTPQPRRKPRRVVLGRGELSFNAEHNATCVAVWVGLTKLYLKGFTHDGEAGTLLWLPDPPKQTKRGKR